MSDFGSFMLARVRRLGGRVSALRESGLCIPLLREGRDQSSISASGKRGRWPIFRYGIASRSTSFRACRSMMFSQAHSSLRVSMRPPVPYAPLAPIVPTPPSRRLSSCRTIGRKPEPESSPGLVQRGLPSLAVGDHMQQAPGVFHVVGVAGDDRFPGVPAGATLLIDTARAFLQWGKHDKAYLGLRIAQQTAPEEVTGRPAVHRIVRQLVTTAPPTVRRDAEDFARHLGVTR